MITTVTLNLVLQMSMFAPGGHDYNAAYTKTNKTGTPLVVLVGADWCPGCRSMKYSVVPQLEKTGSLEKVAFACVNTDQDAELAGKLMRGGSIPQLIMYQKTDKGWKRRQLTGAHSAGEIENFLSQGVAAPPAREVATE